VPNPIKYNASTETLALKKGNFWIGTGDVGKGPTNVTGYYNGITPPAGGFTIYLNKESNGPSIYVASNDAQLISLTNSIAGTSYTTANECLVYFAGQTDKVVLNRNYEGIVTDGLVLNLDAGFTPSYPRSGTTYHNLTTNSYNSELINGTSYSNDVMVFDGVDDQINRGSRNGTSFTDTDNMTVSVFLKINNKNVAGVLGRFSTGAIYDGWTIWVYLDKIIFFNTNEFGNYDPAYNNTGYSFTNGEWFHFAVTRDSVNKTLKWYVNGVLNQEYTTTSSIYRKTNNGISFGHLGNNYYLNGSIGPCQIYNRALTATEVLQNYNAQKGRFGL